MKTTLNKAIQFAVATAALTFATSGHAADQYSRKALNGYLFEPSISSTSFFGLEEPGSTEFSLSVSLYQLTNKANGAQTYLAYCIEPTVSNVSRTYTADYNYQVTTDVRKLYESSFEASKVDAQSQIAFQLALWELQNDKSNNLRTGALSFADHDKSADGATIDATVAQAEYMLTQAAAYNLTTDSYRYVGFTATGAQTLLGVSAVPEADTWAMMAVGLGLVGLVGRRKQKNEKFA